jgi:glutathionyl-hydroquinone reductase
MISELNEMSSINLSLSSAVTVVSPRMGPQGYRFASEDSFPGAEDDPLYNSKDMKDLYLKADPNYSGRFVSLKHLLWRLYRVVSRPTVPVLWDKKTHTIVNNESSEIIRIFNTAFNELITAEKAALDLYPEKLQAEIDELNSWMYPKINSQ